MSVNKGYSIIQRGDNYRITVNIGLKDGKQLRKSTTYKNDPMKTPAQNRRALEKFAVEFSTKARNGLILDGDHLTFKDFIEKWRTEYAEQTMEKSTAYDYTKVIDQKLIQYLGHLKMTHIQPLVIQSMYNDLIEKGYDKGGKHYNYQPATIKRIHAVLSSILSIAVQWQLIESNPCNRIKPPKMTRQMDDIDYFTIEQAERFLEILQEPLSYSYGERTRSDQAGGPVKIQGYQSDRDIPFQYVVFFNIALFGGLRRGENIALTWNDIDFKNNTISITKSTRYVNRVQFDKCPKNKSSNRVITLPPSVMALLSKWKKEQYQYRLSLGDLWHTLPDGTPSNYIYIKWNGEQMCLDSPYGEFKKIIRNYNGRTKIASERLPVISLHGLRHTSATLLISQNIDVKTVAGRLGHNQTSTTMNIYAHALRKKDSEASSALENLLVKKA